LADVAIGLAGWIFRMFCPSAEIAAECFWENVLIIKRIFEFAGFGNEKSSPLKSKA
jgi:hypothetical protein